MARTNATNFTGGLQFPYATAAADLFKKEDVQVLAQAVDQHDHTAGKGAVVNTTPANASITNAMLGSDVARANLLTNGGFEIWQRGTGPFTTNGGFAADRWRIALSGSSTLSISKSSSTPSIGGSSAQVVHAGASAGNTSLYQEWKQGDGLLTSYNFTLSAMVLSSVANAVRLRLNLDTGGYALGAYHSGGGGWERLTVSGVLPNVAVKLESQIEFAAAGTFYIDNMTLVVGSQAADYAPLHPADDLARCQRYYQNWQAAGAVNSVLCSGQAFATTGWDGVVWPVARFAVAPTLTFSPLANWSLLSAAGGNLPCTGLSAQTLPGGNSQINITANVASGLVGGNASLLMMANANVFMAAEANP